MGQVVELIGHSGCSVFLKEYSPGAPYVEKTGDIHRNIERMTALYDAGYRVPRIYEKDESTMRMEYIHGLDIKTHLTYNSIKNLSKFIIGTLESFAKDSVDKDYTEVYNQKLQWLTEQSELPFTKTELIDRLPKLLPQSMYHGDMTLENIISTKDGFWMIDPVTIEYDSYIFDVAKMRQDMECKWFLRHSDIKIDVKLKHLQDRILTAFPLAKNDSLLVLMLLRVFRHCKKDDFNYNFIKQNITKIWKNIN